LTKRSKIEVAGFPPFPFHTAVAACLRLISHCCMLLFQERELAAWQNRSLPVPSGPMRRCAGYGSGGRTEAAAWDA
jgi:hypothetical protein